MTIEKMNIGPHSKKTVYRLTESGATVAQFDTLEEAALVLRFINAAPMTEREVDAALITMRKADKEGLEE